MTDTAQRRLGDPIRGRNGVEAHRTGHFHGDGARPVADDSEGSREGVAGMVGRVCEELGAQVEVAAVAEEQVGGRRRRSMWRRPQQMTKKEASEA
jgi:hypothetical protein